MNGFISIMWDDESAEGYEGVHLRTPDNFDYTFNWGSPIVDWNMALYFWNRNYADYDLYFSSSVDTFQMLTNYYLDANYQMQYEPERI